MRYAFIERHRREWPIVIQCEVQRVLFLAETSAERDLHEAGRVDARSS
jgi:hypothetical protein